MPVGTSGGTQWFGCSGGNWSHRLCQVAGERRFSYARVGQSSPCSRGRLLPLGVPPTPMPAPRRRQPSPSRRSSEAAHHRLRRGKWNTGPRGSRVTKALPIGGARHFRRGVAVLVASEVRRLKSTDEGSRAVPRLGPGMDRTGGGRPPPPAPQAPHIVTKRHDIRHKKVLWSPWGVTIVSEAAISHRSPLHILWHVTIHYRLPPTPSPRVKRKSIPDRAMAQGWAGGGGAGAMHPRPKRPCRSAKTQSGSLHGAFLGLHGCRARCDSST